MSDVVYSFLDHHAPALPAGPYRVNVSLDVAVDAARERETAEAEFFIGGERYSLGPAAIASVYPPEGSRGHFLSGLPQIALSRDTLPWERDPGRPGTPWLALIVLHEAEAARCALVSTTLGAYRAQLGSRKPPLEPGQEDSDPVQTITIDAALAKHVVPAIDELHLLAHVRGHVEHGVLAEGVAVVVSKRLPKRGKNTAHLVSLEGRYLANGSFDITGRDTTLVSLKSWSFHAEEEAPNTNALLAKIFERLGSGWLELPGPPNAARFLSRGCVPLAHRSRARESGVSWYAGPLLPGGAEPMKVELPARSSDALLGYHPDLGMLEVSSAAAWELGRLLALENPAVRRQLSSWRRDRVLDLHHGAAQSGVHQHLPQVQRIARSDLSRGPGSLLDWLIELRKLNGVPYHYLVPDERMLPPESIRFFKADTSWIDALVDGVVSLARPNSKVDAAEQALVSASHAGSWSTGFILRSAAVSGWPGLVIEGRDRHGAVLPVHHRVELSPSTTLCLFRETLGAVWIQPHQDTLHLERTHQPFADEAERVLQLSYSGSAELAKALLHHADALELDVSW